MICHCGSGARIAVVGASADSCHCTALAQAVDEILAPIKYLTYPELGARLFPEWNWGGVNLMMVLIYIGITLTSLGVCAAYFDFIAATMHAVLPSITADMWKVITAALIAPLALLRTFKYLAWSSIVGNVGVIAALVFVIVSGAKQYGEMKDKVNPLDLPAYQAQTFPQFFGAASFLFAIHMLILPLSQSMGENEKEFTLVAYSSYSVLTFMNTVFGAACYMLFQAGTQPTITDNLPATAVRTVVLVILSIAMLFTIPMILAASRHVSSPSHTTYGRMNDSCPSQCMPQL